MGDLLDRGGARLDRFKDVALGGASAKADVHALLMLNLAFNIAESRGADVK
jgi:hypothetical protein